jgi:phage-related protein
MKPISFLGNSLERLREFPDDARQDAGYALDQLQRGLQPSDFKPMPAIARLKETVYVLHAFQKKTQTTRKQDIDIAKARFAELIRGQR